MRVPVRRAAPAAGLIATVLLLTGCGGSSAVNAVQTPQVQAARVFALSSFRPAGRIAPNRPVTVSFAIRTPDGHTLTRYRTGTGPHTGVHLIIVREDLAYIIHKHPPVQADGSFTQTVTFPAPGTYKVLVDAYPNLPGGQPNFQLFHTVQVAGAYEPKSLPAFRPEQVVGGYRFVMRGHPRLHAVQAQFVDVEVTDPAGHKVRFVPWFGALAHAIFFHSGSLDYFHTHVCGSGAPNCTSVLGASRVSGTATPGRLTLGVLLPVPGTWRLFLQMKAGGKILTAPYTLHVSP